MPPEARQNRTSATARKAAPAPVSLTSKAYDAIKTRIVTTAYAPGAYLNESMISAELGIGRTPVRDALHRLAKEGLIDVIPRKGVIVRPFSLDEIAHVIEVRLITEPVCAAMAARRVTRAQLETPKAILQAAQKAIDERSDVEVLMQLDQQFHAWITEVAANPVLAEIILNLHDRSTRHWFLSLSEANHPQQVQEEHMDILRAIGAKDEAAAAESARKHVESSRNTILRVI